MLVSLDMKYFFARPGPFKIKIPSLPWEHLCSVFLRRETLGTTFSMRTTIIFLWWVCNVHHGPRTFIEKWIKTQPEHHNFIQQLQNTLLNNVVGVTGSSKIIDFSRSASRNDAESWGRRRLFMDVARLKIHYLLTNYDRIIIFIESVSRNDEECCC